MKDFKIVLENEFSRRWNSKPQGGVYEHFVCLSNRYNGVHRLIFREDKEGTIHLLIDGRSYKYYRDWNALRSDWILPLEITVYADYQPGIQRIERTEGSPDAFYG